MNIRYFESVRFPGDWELNIILRKLTIRIGRSQIALWWKLEPLFCWLAPRARCSNQ